jgi:hypothetical protein
MLALDNPPGAAPAPSLGGEPAFEEKGDKSYELTLQLNHLKGCPKS